MNMGHRARIHFMDELRGFAVLCMVVRHAFYLIGYMFEREWAQRLFDFFGPASPFFAGAFVLISGISAELSRSNLKRGARLLAIALGMTAVTAIVIPSEIIRFGVLHMLAVCMLTVGLLKRLRPKTAQAESAETPKSLFDRIPTAAGIAVCAVLFVLTAGLFFGETPYVGVPGVPSLQICALTECKFLFPLGIRAVGFYSSDYYPVLPWIFLFLIGTFLGRFAAAERFPKWMYPARAPFFSVLGRHALLIYILHQPILYGIMTVLTYFFENG